MTKIRRIIPVTAQTARPPSIDALANLVVAESSQLAKDVEQLFEGESVIGQDTMRRCHYLKAAGKALDKAVGSFESLVKARRDLSPSKMVEATPGEFVLQVNVVQKCSPSWKEEAIALARQITELQGRPFSQEQFEADVQRRYGVKEAVSVSILRV